MPVRGKNAGNKGQGSKWITPKRRRQIYDRDGWKCVWCKECLCQIPGCTNHGPATLDHITPRSEGGSNESTNLITCCMKCNRLRGNTYWHDFARERARSFDTTVVTLFGRFKGPTLTGHSLRLVANEIRRRIRWRMVYGHV